MSSKLPMLHLICGKIASGKSTLAAALGGQAGTIVIAEEDWLAALYSHEMVSISDYVRCAARVRQAMGPHVVALLQANVSVVLDFPANTIADRRWMRELIHRADVAHQLHHLDTPDEICLARLHKRNAAGGHAFTATDAQFTQISKHFVTPLPDEGFDIVLHRIEGGL